MTPQEIFDTVVIHLFKQGRRSQDDHFVKYRGPDGLMCSVGVLMDDFYKEHFDSWNKSAKELLKRHREDLPDWFEEHILLLSDLQSVHDVNYNWEDANTMVKKLLEIAARHKLKDYSVIKFKRSFNGEELNEIE